MKVNRIDVMIKRDLNKHVQYLDNKTTQLMRDYKFGGVYSNEHIKFNSMPETVLEKLKEFKIKFERIINERNRKDV